MPRYARLVAIPVVKRGLKNRHHIAAVIYGLAVIYFFLYFYGKIKLDKGESSSLPAQLAFGVALAIPFLFIYTGKVR